MHIIHRNLLVKCSVCYADTKNNMQHTGEYYKEKCEPKNKTKK